MNVLDKLLDKGVIETYTLRRMHEPPSTGHIFSAMAWMNLKGEDHCISMHGHTLRDAQTSLAVEVMLKAIDEKETQTNGATPTTEDHNRVEGVQ